MPSVSMSIYLGCRITIECKTRQDKEIQGINIFGKELKYTSLLIPLSLIVTAVRLTRRSLYWTILVIFLA